MTPAEEVQQRHEDALKAMTLAEFAGIFTFMSIIIGIIILSFPLEYKRGVSIKKKKERKNIAWRFR